MLNRLANIRKVNVFEKGPFCDHRGPFCDQKFKGGPFCVLFTARQFSYFGGLKV